MERGWGFCEAERSVKLRHKVLEERESALYTNMAEDENDGEINEGVGTEIGE